MEIFNTISSLQSTLSRQRQKGNTVGFVPTMGALHNGHISLINRAKQENDLVVCSIFVNPHQFNNKEDLNNYPRTPEFDHQLLEKANCDFLFEPEVDEMYPKDTSTNVQNFNFENLDTVMEGKYRPGHFIGVAKVVSRLFDIVNPDKAYFGEKDFQQLAIIKRMNEILEGSVEVIGCQTLRTDSGLALSSRNIHLNEEELFESPVIYKTLLKSADLIQEFGIEKARNEMIIAIEKKAGFKVEYLEFVDSKTLKPINKIQDDKEQRVCIAVLTKNTRLIDNIAI